MDDIYVKPYFPTGVKYIVTTGGSHYIGFIDDTTVLKYPHFPGELNELQVELRIFQELGKHPRIIEFKGEHKDGLLLEYGPNGTLEKYLQAIQLPIKERLQLAKQIAEGVIHAHERNVLICDIHVRNVLLDASGCVKLCDFQGRLLDTQGKVIVDGGASENAESFMPRATKDLANTKTDIFALGSTIYHIITGHRPFPQYNTIDDEAKFVDYYRKGDFSMLDALEGGGIIKKCWEGKYENTSEVLDDILDVERNL